MKSRNHEPQYEGAGVAELVWNFDDVPDDELAACCLWEYTRESPSFTLSSCSKVRELPSNPKTKRRYEAFLDAFWNSDEGYMEYYETIRTNGGPDALPWQQMSPEIRARLKEEVGVHSVSYPCGPARRGQLESLWKTNLAEWERTRNESDFDPDEEMMEYDHSYPHIEGPGHAGETHGETIAAFAIDFRKFNDKEICKAFSDWVKGHRPGGSPGPSRRGKKRRDLRVALDRLGIMRLLHRFTLTEIQQCCPEAAKAFAGYDWYKERKRANINFRSYFHFLPKEERPLSWPTKGGRSK